MSAGIKSHSSGLYGALQVGGADVLRFGSDNSGQLAGFRNRIINGGCHMAQRGNAAVVVNTVQFGGCDRFINLVVGSTASGTIQQVRGIPTESNYAHGFVGLTTTGTTTVLCATRLESKDVFHMSGKSAVARALVYQNTGLTLTLTGSLVKANALDNFTTDTTIGSSSVSVPSDVWTPVAFSFALGSTDAANGLSFNLAYNNIAAVSGKNFYFGDWQLEEGSVATPFEHRPIGLELALCQRYYETASVYVPDAASLPTNWFFKVEKRVTPTIASGAAGYTNFVITTAAAGHRQTTAGSSLVTASAEL